MGGKLLFYATLCWAVYVPGAYAQKVNVAADITAPDDVGRQLASRLRIKLASSPLLTFVASDDRTSLKVKLVTLNPDNGYSQNYTVYSEVIVLHSPGEAFDSYLSSYVGTCGRNKVDQCADSLFADIDEWADVIRKAGNKSNP